MVQEFVTRDDPMIETVAPGLHDAILLGAGIAAVYLVVALLQLFQLSRHQPPAAVREPLIEPQYRSETVLNASDKVKEDRDFADHLRSSKLEASVQRLSGEVAALRDALSATRVEVDALRTRSNAQPVKHEIPSYNDAMDMAKRGLSAVGIASRCGISMSEAELVAALARHPKKIDSVAEIRLQSANGENDELRSRYRAAA